MKKIICVFMALAAAFAFTATAIAATETVVSDTSVGVYGPIDHYAGINSGDWGTSKSAVATWPHPSWPTISGATWIGSAYYTETPTISTWRMFEDQITLPACATNISGNVISMTSDNAEEVYLNGVLIGSDGEVQGAFVDNQEWSSVKNYPLNGLSTNTNTLKVIVRNYGLAGSTPTSNPTGLVYKTVVNYTLADADADGYDCSKDCNDNNAAMNPGAAEICDGIDNDCDGSIDEGLTAPLAGNQKGVCSGAVKVCAGKDGWIEPVYANLPYYQNSETRCDTLDNDCDGSIDEGGICEYHCQGNPVADSPDVELGTNRWIWNGTAWQTNAPSGKGPKFVPTLAGTHNCSCEQILTWLHTNLPETYGEMNGHWKYGCSQSAIQEFMDLADDTATFSASGSFYYNGPTDGSGLYGSGPIAFTWNPVTHQVTGGYYTEQVPANTGTLYYNMIVGGAVNGTNVTLNFNRVNPNAYNFGFIGTLIGNVLSGNLDGPYLFTATGTVTP